MPVQLATLRRVRRLVPFRRAFIAAIAVVLTTLPLSIVPAHAASSISINHVPPTVLTAGDNIVLTATFTYTCDPTQYCGDRKARLVWIDAKGTTRTLERSGGQGTTGTTYSGGTSVTVWPVTVPGTDIGAPSFRYHFEAEMGSVGIAGSGGGGTFYGRSPANGDNVVNVDNEIRLRFVYPDGSAAPNVGVEISGPAAGASWATTTDAQGWMRFTIPRTSAWVASLVTGQKQGAVLVKAFDQPMPTQGATPGSPVSVNGNGRYVAMQLNYGRLLDTKPGLQDKQVRLLPMTDQYFDGADLGMSRESVAGQTCYDAPRSDGRMWQECLNTYDGGVQLTPVGENMGGGIDTQGSYSYKTSARTSTTTAFSGGYGSWSEIEGEVTAENNRDVVQETGLMGPNNKHGFGALMQYILREERSCPYNNYQTNPQIDWSRCQRKAWFKPYDWPGAVRVTDYSLYDKWDTACDKTVSDCNDFITRLYSTYETTVASSAGFKWGYTVSVGPWDWVQLHTKTKYGKTETGTTEVKLTFKTIASPTRPYQYVFVPEGALSGRTPATSPELVYTAVSDHDIENYTPEAPNVPCATCNISPPTI